MVWLYISVQNFVQYHPHYPRSCQGQGHRLRIMMFKFYVKVFRISLLLNQMMDLVPIWYHDRYWSKVFISTISTHDHDLEVEVTVFVKVFKTSLFPNLITDLIHLWYDDTYWSKILPISILTTLDHVKVKATVMQKFSC